MELKTKTCPFKKAKNVVHEVLKNYPSARVDDFICTLLVYEYYMEDVSLKTFGDIMRNHKQYGLPPFETVRRWRAKLQAEYPDLANEMCVLNREQRQEEVLSALGYKTGGDE